MYVTERNFRFNLDQLRIKTFTLRQIPVPDDESGADSSSRRIKNFTLRQIPVRDDKSGPDSSSRTGICLSVKVFIRLVQIQPEISLSV